MTQICIVSCGVVDLQKLASLDALPAFRKATHNMKMACVALEAALLPLQSKKQQWQPELGLFLGTGHGEFNSTIEFLKSWAEHKHARPFVFQNSLHNSTTGFLGLFESIQAPSCTLSHHYFSGEDALDTAGQFLKTGQCKIAAVVGVDARTLDHLPMMSGAGFPDAQWGEGAGCVIVATEEYAKELRLPILGYLKDIQVQPNFDRPVHFVQDDFPLYSFYDAHAVETLARSILSGNDAGIQLEKPNGGRSHIFWSKHV